jgi:hypothetical protein
MSPAFWESKATKLYRCRGWLGGASLFAFLAIGVSGFLEVRVFAVASAAVGFPIVVIAWGLLCAASWFEPTKGSLSPNGWLGRHAPSVNTVARWWAAFLLPLFFAAGVLAPIWWLLNVT